VSTRGRETHHTPPTGAHTMAFIKGKQLAAGTINTRELKDLAVTNGKINDTEITSAKLNISGEAWDFSGASAFSVPTPTADAHAVTKGYADAVAQGLDVKESVRAAGSINVTGRFDFIGGKIVEDPAHTSFWQVALNFGGVSLAQDDRVLLNNQTNPERNGIWYVESQGNGSTIPWRLARATDADSADKLNNGAFVFVGEGTYEGAGYVLTTPDPITLGTTSLTFTQFSGAGQITAGDGLTKTGNTLALDLLAAGGLEIDTAQLAIKLEDASLVLSSNGLKVQHHNSSTATGANGILAAVPVSNRLERTPLAVSVDGGSTGVSMLIAQAAGSRVDVYVNGVRAALGDGVKTLDCYFSSDSGATAKSYANIAGGDVLYWNGASVYALETDDRVSILYNAVL
jgi:hypothetical protein